LKEIHQEKSYEINGLYLVTPQNGRGPPDPRRSTAALISRIWQTDALVADAPRSWPSSA
jgi:hypothetical protein